MLHMLHRLNSTCVCIHILHMLACKMAVTSNTAIDGDIEAS